MREAETRYPWWWERATEKPTVDLAELRTTAEPSRGGRWWKPDWWRSILKPKHVKKAIKLFRDLDNDE
jgi:hypothetical protein